MSHQTIDVGNKDLANLCVTHKSAYDQWFLDQVQASLDDQRTAVSNEEVKKRFALKREVLQKKIGG